ncbi:S8 family serine peptidase [Microtetraspora malaysiensis]|uniref:S8 family serine peptidase n=1 Tax=Microtetraspora malaysiensis TaxID=161358 RepID=UPI0012F88AB5|nr:S8 family serine peptidase [Microtetraspora malaysiensis]
MALLVSALLTAAPPVPPHTTPASAATTAPVTVTLITGDRVTVTGPAARRSVAIERGEGRTGVSFVTDDTGGRLRVIPTDAFGPLQAGELDPRLFEVATLIESGYDDRRGDLPLIVTGTGADRKGMRAEFVAAGAKVTRDLPAAQALAVRAGKKGMAGFWKGLTAGRTLSGGGRKVWLDALLKPSLDVSVPQIGAPAAWEAGHTGADVKVAVLDSGIDATHPDLTGKVAAQANFTDNPDSRDLSGHGTHVAATIAGGGKDSRYKGVAPGAILLDGKVCDGLCSHSSLIAGMEWAAEQGAKVINLSLGGTDTVGLDPMELAVQTLSERYGALFVVAAGNEYSDRAVNSPASADAALAVGAVNSSEELAEFSSRGPRVGDSGLKPEITAPGVDITAARSKDSEGTGSHVTFSGTSMATPHVAGAAAIVFGQHPDWTGEQVKAALMGSARRNSDFGAFDQGAGRVDVARAVTQQVTAEPAGVGFGLLLWPHGDKALTRTVTYRNRSASPVTLKLAVEGDPGRVFSVTPDGVEVPAGGKAEVTVTADARTAPVEQPMSGYLVAKDTGATGIEVSTPLGLEKESEKYELTIKHLDRAGNLASGHSTSLRRLDDTNGRWRMINASGAGGVATVRVPKGVWEISSFVQDGAQTAYLVHPGLRVEQAQTLEVDARLSRPLAVGLPVSSAVPDWAAVSYGGPLIEGTAAGQQLITERLDQILTAQIGPPQQGAVTRVDGQWRDERTGAFYRLAWFHRDGMITGFQRRVTQQDLATIRADHARHLDGARGFWDAEAQLPDLRLDHFPGGTPVALPSVQTIYVNSDSQAIWKFHLTEMASTGENNGFEGAFTRYTPGRVYAESWNRGVFGPYLPSDGREDSGSVTREGDVITVSGQPYGDGAGRLCDCQVDATRTALYRDGTLLDEQSSAYADFTVPEEEAVYRLVMEAERGAPAALSTRVSVAWTFRSGRTDKAATRLPVSVVRFSPPLDADNSAPAGRSFTVPLTVQRQAGSAAGEVRDLSVEVSYDDGATWSAAKVHRSAAILRHPDGEGFVSLRARSTDATGNTVEQTVIRAYRIAPAT